MKSKPFRVFLMVAVMVVPALAQDTSAPKKKQQESRQPGPQNLTAQTLKQLEDVKLTDQQVAKIKSLGKTVAAKMKTIREDAGITPELTKKRAEAQKALKDSGKKGKALAAEVNKTAGYNEAQVAAIQKINQTRTEFKKQVIAMLTDEQKPKLPQGLKQLAESSKDAKPAPPGKKQQN